jgi:hypothetical protein
MKKQITIAAAVLLTAILCCFLMVRSNSEVNPDGDRAHSGGAKKPVPNKKSGDGNDYTLPLHAGKATSGESSPGVAKASMEIESPNDFFTRIKGMKDGERRKELRELAGKIVRNGLRESLDAYVAASPSKEDVWELLLSYGQLGIYQSSDGRKVIESDPGLISLMPSKYKDSLLGTWATAVSLKGDPAGGAALVQQFNAYSDPSAARMLASRWALKDANACLNWIQTIPEGDFRDHSFRGLMASWVKSDEAGAVQFLSGLQPGYTRDLALAEMAKSFSTVSVKRAFAWADEIQDVQMRENIMGVLEPLQR